MKRYALGQTRWPSRVKSSTFKSRDLAGCMITEHGRALMRMITVKYEQLFKIILLPCRTYSMCLNRTGLLNFLQTYTYMLLKTNNPIYIEKLNTPVDNYIYIYIYNVRVITYLTKFKTVPVAKQVTENETRSFRLFNWNCPRSRMVNSDGIHYLSQCLHDSFV